MAAVVAAVDPYQSLPKMFGVVANTARWTSIAIQKGDACLLKEIVR